MITLVQFAPAWGLSSGSPFCIKVETVLRMAAIEYRVEYQNDPRKAPKGKFPYIKDKESVIPDSETIIAYLIDKYQFSLDEHLSAQELALMVAIKRVCEDHLYWALVYSRWIDDRYWPLVKKEFFRELPLLLKPVVPELAKKTVVKSLDGQGFGRHSKEEVYQKGQEDITALATLLGSNSYMLCDKVCSIDATVYGVLASILYAPLQTPLQTHLKTFANLVSYCERIKSSYFAEY